jgi:hypothetical protein
MIDGVHVDLTVFFFGFDNLGDVFEFVSLHWMICFLLILTRFTPDKLVEEEHFDLLFGISCNKEEVAFEVED